MDWPSNGDAYPEERASKICHLLGPTTFDSKRSNKRITLGVDDPEHDRGSQPKICPRFAPETDLSKCLHIIYVDRVPFPTRRQL